MSKKVIIIDDSTTALNLLKTIFAKNSWEVYGAKSAKIAYEMIFDLAPDLIITDAIMPVMGGFQLVKNIRENEKISKIPVIVYSVLPESNAKFYIKEDLIEYFLTKNENYDELLELAEKIIEKFPIDETYKSEILKAKFEPKKEETAKIPPQLEEVSENIDQKAQEDEITPEKPQEVIIDADILSRKFKENYNFSLSDEKLFSEIFAILYPSLKYDLFTISAYPNRETFFDIRDIILSPIFQNAILAKDGTKEIVLFKKYAPNLKMIINEEEFCSKAEFDFEYKETTTARVAFYSLEKNKWENEENLEAVKNALYDFFKARYINKCLSQNKKENLSDKYFTGKFDFAILNKTETEEENAYAVVIEIANFADLQTNLSREELDIMNSKISEKIINYLEKDEQIYKNDEDEYIAMIFAKDEKQAKHKLNCIANILSTISYNTYKIEPLIGASNCNIEGNFNIYEAQKIAREAVEEATATEKTVIK